LQRQLEAMECEIYNEIAELKSSKVQEEIDIIDWFEVYKKED